MKRQRPTYGDALPTVKIESSAGVEEPGLSSRKESSRSVKPRMRRRDGGGAVARRSGSERDGAYGEEQPGFADNARPRGSREGSGGTASDSGLVSKGHGSKGLFTRREEREEEAGMFSPSSGKDRVEEKMPGTETHAVEAEETMEGSKVAAVPEAEKSSEMEEGELEPDGEAPGSGEQGPGGDIQRKEVREMQPSEEAGGGGGGNLRVEENGEEGERGAPAAETIAITNKEAQMVEATCSRSHKPVLESTVKRSMTDVTQELAEPQWRLKMAAQKYDEAGRDSPNTQEELKFSKDWEREGGRGARQRGVSQGIAGEEDNLAETERRKEEGETDGIESAGHNLMTSNGRERDREREREDRREEERQNEKKQRVENGSLLSLALPDTSLSLSSGDPHSRPHSQQHPAHSHPSHGPRQTHSRGFTNSLSLSHSQPFQHNPSCSLTQTSLDKTELSSGSQQMSVGKEQGSYGSWQFSYGSNQGNEGFLAALAQDRRKPKALYQRLLQSGNNPQILQGSLGSERLRSQGREKGSEGVENTQASHQVPAADVAVHVPHSSDGRRSQRRDLQHKLRHSQPGEVWSSPSHSASSRETQPRDLALKGDRTSSGERPLEGGSAGVERELTGTGLQDVVSEPIPSMARRLQDLPDSFLEGLKESLRDMLNSIEKREQFVLLQQTLAGRTDLTSDTLRRAHRAQLELLVAIKTGIPAFLQAEIPMAPSALAEVFLQTRCRNFACQSQLPADECDCKLCTQKTGFCNSCMCVVCSKFDFDANTCRWIGCDFCLHWCHTDCGLRMSYIAPGPSIRGAAGTSEMQFRCIACGHTSELYGFVKDVFCTCAPEWGKDVLASELDCVRRIFHGSTDARGQQLCSKAELILQQLNAQADPTHAWRTMVKFFSEGDTVAAATQGQEAPVTKEPVKSPPVVPSNHQKSSRDTRETLERARAALQTYDTELEEKRQEAAELKQERERKKAQIEELESIVRIKQAEAKMFASRADEARREAEGLQRIMLAKAEKIDQEYSIKLLKLGLEEAQDRCHKQHDTVQVLHQGQLDFQALKLPLLTELHELLKQLDASKRQSWK